MAYKTTLAIIGATTTVGAFIAKSIATNYRLLLVDTEQDGLVLLQHYLQDKNRAAEIEVLECYKDASWEADIIIVTVGGTTLKEVAFKMEEVATCKTVIHFTGDDTEVDQLQILLPYSKVVTVLLNQVFTIPDENVTAFIKGKDDEAIQIAKNIVSAIGLTAQTIISEDSFEVK